jgi:hypothetical protein
MNIPTEPGLYVSERYPLNTEDNYMPYYLDSEGVWWEIGEPGIFPNYEIDNDDIGMYGPFRRLGED